MDGNATLLGQEARKNFWSDSRQLNGLMLAFATALIFYGCAQIIMPFLYAMVWALTLAVTVSPLHRKIHKRFKNKTLAAGLVTFLAGLFIMAPLVFVAFELLKEAQNALEMAQQPEFQAKVQEFTQKHKILGQLKINGQMDEHIKTFSTAMATRLPAMASVTLWKLTEWAISLLIVFFLLRDRDRFQKKTRDLLPLKPEENDLVFSHTRDTIRATVNGHILMALIQGILGGLVFLALGLPGPLLWGAVMAILAVLPVLGAALIWIPAAAFLFLTGAWAKGLILVVFGSVVIGLIDNLLYPLLVGKKIRQHTLLVFLSLVGGLAAFGSVGLIAGPLLLCLLDCLIKIWRHRSDPQYPLRSPEERMDESKENAKAQVKSPISRASLAH